MAAIVDRRRFAWGLVLGAGFLAMLPVLFAPLFGGEPLLQRADRFFSGLAKGSARFADSLAAAARRFDGTPFAADLTFKEADASAARTILEQAGCEVAAARGRLAVHGDLGRVAAAVVRDCDDAYTSGAPALAARYGPEGRRILYLWWQALDQMERKAKAAGRAAEGRLLEDLRTRGVETSYNFLGLEARKVGDHLPLVAGLLAGYVLYTVWCGFAIYLMFQGLGLKATAPKRPQAGPDTPPGPA